MTKTILMSVLTVLAMCLVACGGEDDAKDVRQPTVEDDPGLSGDADADGDSDGDADGDSDGDADGDADGDTDADADSDADGDDVDTDEDTSSQGTDKELKSMWNCLICD